MAELILPGVCKEFQKVTKQLDDEPDDTILLKQQRVY